jgi:hypothetical protein
LSRFSTIPGGAQLRRSLAKVELSDGIDGANRIVWRNFPAALLTKTLADRWLSRSTLRVRRGAISPGRCGRAGR